MTGGLIRVVRKMNTRRLVVMLTTDISNGVKSCLIVASVSKGFVIDDKIPNNYAVGIGSGG